MRVMDIPPEALKGMSFSFGICATGVNSIAPVSLPADGGDCVMIYFIQSGDDGPIKIGVSGNPKARLCTLQLANPYQLKLIGLHLGDAGDECVMHKELEPYRVRNKGEWYWPCEAVLDRMWEGMARDLPADIFEAIRSGQHEADVAMMTLTLKQKGWEPKGGWQ